jgi:hypothetical protein
MRSKQFLLWPNLSDGLRSVLNLTDEFSVKAPFYLTDPGECEGNAVIQPTYTSNSVINN